MPRAAHHALPPRLAACQLLAAGAARPEAPADCSRQAPPDAAIVLRIDDAAHPLPVVTLRSQQSMTVGDAEKERAFDVLYLALRDAENIFPPREVSVQVLVGRGEALAGRSFRRLPTLEIRAQPTPLGEEYGTWISSSTAGRWRASRTRAIPVEGRFEAKLE